MVSTERSLQEQIPHNHCFGCGPRNRNGLGLKSYWPEGQASIARFLPSPYQSAAPRHVVNGGIIATLIDCHCICTATAAAYRQAGRSIGTQPEINFATAALEVRYRRPAPIRDTLELSARVLQETARGYVVACTLTAAGRQCATAVVEAVRVSDAWMQGRD